MAGRGRPKGQAKTGGRKAGTPNRRTQESVIKAELGGEMPLDYAIRIMRDESQPPERRDWACHELFPYLHAKRVPETKNGTAAGVTVIIEQPDA